MGSSVSFVQHFKQVFKMQVVVQLFALGILCLVSANALRLPSDKIRVGYPAYPDTANALPSHKKRKDSVGTTTYDPWDTTTTGRPTTTRYPTTYPPTTPRPYSTTTNRPTTTWNPPASTTTRHPSTPTYPPTKTTPEPSNEHCFGHFIYKEEHNIIVDGEDDRHKDVYECEYACTMITDCRFWKYTMGGEHKGYCELNRGTPLNHGEVVGQRNVKLVPTPYGPYCWFEPNDGHPHHQDDDN